MLLRRVSCTTALGTRVCSVSGMRASPRLRLSEIDIRSRGVFVLWLSLVAIGALICRILYCDGTPTCCSLSPDRAHVAFAGQTFLGLQQFQGCACPDLFGLLMRCVQALRRAVLRFGTCANRPSCTQPSVSSYCAISSAVVLTLALVVGSGPESFVVRSATFTTDDLARDNHEAPLRRQGA